MEEKAEREASFRDWKTGDSSNKALRPPSEGGGEEKQARGLGLDRGNWPVIVEDIEAKVGVHGLYCALRHL